MSLDETTCGTHREEGFVWICIVIDDNDYQLKIAEGSQTITPMSTLTLNVYTC